MENAINTDKMKQNRTKRVNPKDSKELLKNKEVINETVRQERKGEKSRILTLARQIWENDWSNEDDLSHDSEESEDWKLSKKSRRAGGQANEVEEEEEQEVIEPRISKRRRTDIQSESILQKGSDDRKIPNFDRELDNSKDTLGSQDNNIFQRILQKENN